MEQCIVLITAIICLTLVLLLAVCGVVAVGMGSGLLTGLSFSGVIVFLVISTHLSAVICKFN